MANALDTVADYVSAARVLLQDTYGPNYRYPSIDIVNALNFALLRARQLRADLFILSDGAIQFFTGETDQLVVIDVMYREAVLNFIVGQIQLRDDEDTTDARAAALKNAFVTQLSLGAGADAGTEV